MDTDKAEKRSLRRWFVALFASIAVIVVPPLFGLLGTVIGMVRAFKKIRTGGSEDPAALADDISVALFSTAGGLAVSIIGLVGLVISVIGVIMARRKCEAKASAAE